MILRRAISGLCLVVLLVPSFAAAAAQKTSVTNVTTLVHDSGLDGTQLLMRSDDYNGSGQATYSSNKSGLSNSIVSGEWVLSLLKQSLRTLWITPNDPVGSQPAGPPAGYYWQSVEVKSVCFDQNANTVPLPNVVSSSGNCKLGVNFKSGGTLYKLLMSPFPLSQPGDSPPTCPSTGCPASGVATVTCNKVSNSQCVSWTIVPNANAPNANVANLYWYNAPTPTTATWVFIGQYYNTFRIDVTNP